MYKLKPLEEWYCDKCNEIIDKNGFLEWLYDEVTALRYDFKIVQSSCRFHHGENGERDVQIIELLSYDGLARLYNLLDMPEVFEKENRGPRVKDIREFVEIMRRLTIPLYEEARIYLKEAYNEILNGVNENKLYSQEVLKKVIEKYSIGK